MRFMLKGNLERRNLVLSKWNKTRTSINKFFKLSNGQWFKIIFSYKSSVNIWYETIVVANSKRQCNDCVHKTRLSPKVTYTRLTGNRLGLEAFKIALHELLKFEKTVKNTQINIIGASERLNEIYKYLKRYDYIQYEYEYEKNKKPVSMMYKKIK